MPLSLSFTPLCVLTFALLLKSCESGIDKTVKPSSIQDFYLGHNWIPLDIPDSKFAPGTIIHVTAKSVEYVSSVKTCGVPDEVVAVVPGSSPKLTFTATSTYGASAVLKIAGVQAGPDWKKVKTTTLEQDDHGSDAIDLLRFQIWLTDPANRAKIPAACTDFLNKPDNYIVHESYRVSKGKYTLHGENGIDVKVTGLQLGPVTISPDGNAKVTDDGGVEFTQVEYTAIKRLSETNGLLNVLGPGDGPADADQKVRRLLFPTSK